jgi:hypothetical protein
LLVIDGDTQSACLGNCEINAKKETQKPSHFPHCEHLPKMPTSLSDKILPRHFESVASPFTGDGN